ncbi:4811_t:CDS:10, partial [Funneliformis mosseae]
MGSWNHQEDLDDTNMVVGQSSVKEPDSWKLEKLSTTNPNFYSLLEDSNLVVSNKNTLTESKSVDDKEIKRLEKKLGIKSGGKLTKAFEEDGLDELLQGFEIGSKNLKKSKFISEENEEIDTSHYNDDDFDESEHESDDENSDMMEEESDVEMEPESNIYEKPEANEAKGKYIPPHLQRKTFTSESDEAKKEHHIRLQRQLQGLLNRLSESNIESIIINIEELYQRFTRHAAFYKIIGIDFCAHFVQEMIEEFERYHKQYSSTSDDVKNLEGEGGKEIFITDLNELNVELLLKIVRSSGYQLRQDDPTALKEIIHQVQAETSKKNPRTLGSRLKFMIETIINLKNNRFKQQDFIANTENVLRIKKFLNNLGKRIHVQATETLRVSLDDIKSIETK